LPFRSAVRDDIIGILGAGFDPDAIIDCGPNSLLAAEVALGSRICRLEKTTIRLENFSISREAINNRDEVNSVCVER
jgi:hypothetical protein